MFERIAITKDSVIGTVGNSCEYAGYHEYGFTGVEQVRDHYRTITQAFGRPISAREVFVRAHQRNVNYPGRPFMRPALAEMVPKITTKLEQAIREATSE